MITPRPPSLDAYFADATQAEVYIMQSGEPTESTKCYSVKKKKDIRDKENKRLGKMIHFIASSGPRYQFFKKNEFEQARNDLVTLNLSYVVSIAKGYQNKGVLLDDLIQEGNLGLIRAAELYNPDHSKEGIKFVTYADEWIRSFIRRAIQTEVRGNLPIPHKICSDRERIENITKLLSEELGETPTSTQVAERFNQSYYPKGPKNSQIDFVHVEALKIATTHLERIDRRNEDGEYCGDMISNCPTPYNLVSNNDELEKMLSLLNDGTLEDRERTLITYRFGLDGNGERTLKEIGQVLGLTRERIRQIEGGILLKLRAYMKGDRKRVDEKPSEAEEVRRRFAA